MTVISRTERLSKRASIDMFSEIIGISPVADMVHPRSDGSPRGRHSFGAGDSRSLPWAMIAQRSALFPLPLPPSQPATALTRGAEHIDPRPDLGGRAPAQMLMRPEVVIDRSNLLQGLITRCRIVERVVPQQSFDRADQPLDPAILPGTARFAVLQANAQEVQCEAESPRRKHRFVVRAQHVRAAILPTGGDEVAPDRPRRLIRQALDTQASPAGMIDDRQRQMLSAMGIGVGQQVHPPNQIARHRTRHAMFQAPSCTEDGVLLASNCVGDVGFADGHLSTDREAPVEGVHDRAAARMGHEGFQANQFIAHPTRFGWRMRSAAWAGRAGTGQGGSWSRLSPSTQPVPQPGTPSNEPAQSMQQHSPPATSWITKWMAM